MLYVRVSTADQRTDSQTEKLKAFCQGRGYAKVRLFVEKESGAKMTRPQLDAMMGEIRSGRVARVVVYKLDRLGPCESDSRSPGADGTAAFALLIHHPGTLTEIDLGFLTGFTLPAAKRNSSRERNRWTKRLTEV